MTPTDKNRLSIKEWISENRPREKLLSKGAKTLTNAELLAILMRSGTKDKTAVDLAQQILRKYSNDLNDLGSARYSELMKFKGIGPAKAISILAALELGRRRNSGVSGSKPQIKSSFDTFEYINSELRELPHEEFWIILLSRSNRVITREVISRGGVSGTYVDAKIIFQKALDHLASSLILVHNHPSGQLKPSEQDIRLTKKLVEAAKLLDMSILDHLIVAGDTYFSFADEGLFAAR